MDDGFMTELENIKTTLSQVEKDTGKLRSDTNDIKTNQATMNVQLASLMAAVDKLNTSVFGNGKKGFETRLAEIMADVESNTEFRQDIKKFGWAIIGLLVGNIILGLLGK